MNQDAGELWNRAVRSLETSTKLVSEDPDAAASRAYYAAFYAVSALFALQERTFTKHRAVEAAVHRDLVKPGMWTVDMGATFSELVRLRRTGDYGGRIHVSQDEAQEAVNKARCILQAVQDTNPDFFTKPDR
ncbi:MAG TPA: HEPN domain-containing protein [Candidatus Binatia bacterium]|jgi:hypothetical protein|nr:HEPN domain-containing protein [Candidatus Binatia bacterium]